MNEDTKIVKYVLIALVCVVFSMSSCSAFNHYNSATVRSQAIKAGMTGVQISCAVGATGTDLAVCAIK